MHFMAVEKSKQRYSFFYVLILKDCIYSSFEKAAEF